MCLIEHKHKRRHSQTQNMVDFKRKFINEWREKNLINYEKKQSEREREDRTEPRQKQDRNPPKDIRNIRKKKKQQYNDMK